MPIVTTKIPSALQRMDGGFGVLEMQTHTLQGTFPAVPVYEGVDEPGLYHEDGKPFHVTLPVLERNRVSENGLLYDEELVSLIEDQLFGKGGNLGHVEQLFAGGDQIEAIDWIGHVRENDVTWALGYIPPGEHREYVRRIKKRGGKLGSSILGFVKEFEWVDEERDVYRLPGFELIKLDIMTAEQASLRTGLRYGFDISEAIKRRYSGFRLEEKQEAEEATMELKDIPENLRQQIIAEAQVQADAKRVNEIQAESEQRGQRITELEGNLAERETEIQSLRAAQEAAQQQLADLQNARFERELTDLVEAKTKSWNLTTEEQRKDVAALHKLVKEAAAREVGDNRTIELATQVVERLWSSDYKLFVEAIVVKLSGPAAVVNGQANSNANWREQYLSDEGRKSLKQKWGLN